MILNRCYGKFCFSTLFQLGCLIGFLIQTIGVCKMYFEYQTSSSIELRVDDKMNMPSLSLCVRYYDILNRTNHEKYGIHPNWSGHIGVEHDQSKLTIRQIFELTPTGNATIDKCHRRSKDMEAMDGLSRKDCLKELNITKYFMQENVCYAYTFTTLPTFSHTKVAHSLLWRLMIIEIQLTPFLDRNWAFVYFMVHFGTPLFSRNFGRPDIISKPIPHDITYRYNEIHLLEPPYDTLCTKVEGQDRDRCFRSCMIDGLGRKLNRFPYSEITSEPIDLQHVTPKELQMRDKRKIIARIDQDCREACKRPNCLAKFAYTTVYSLTTASFNFTSLSLLAPQSASTIIRTNPVYTFLDFFIYICSCFGIWFGLSILSFNPTTMWEVVRSRMSRQKKRGVRKSRKFYNQRQSVLRSNSS